ncbi:MAG: class I SAM-dependent methyltransferase [Cyanobacteria bacterium P01_F01_bin.3]
MGDYQILSHQQARKYYSSAVAKQDQQSHYEDPPIEWLLQAGRFDHAENIVEFGCGTGRLAQKMLMDVLPSTATYIGFDISAPMVELSKQRVQKFGSRSRVVRTDGETQFELSDNSCDRFLSTYVLDLLSTTDIASLLAEAHRILKPNGLLCLAGLTHGFTLKTKIAMGLWSLAHRVRPTLVGGCRPLRLAKFIDSQQWNHFKIETFTAGGIPSEAIIVEKTN